MKKETKKISNLMMALGAFVDTPVTEGATDVTVASGNLTVGDMVYFGTYDGNTNNTPVLWRVVRNLDGTITLFCARDVGKRPYDSSQHKYWSGSDICQWLNGMFLTGAFSAAEQRVIATYGGTSVEDTANKIVIDESQQIVLPSYAEVRDGGTWRHGGGTSEYEGTFWWLRSPGEDDNSAAIAYTPMSIFDADGFSVGFTYGIRPAFNIKLSSVLFTFAAEDGKSGATAGSDTLVGVSAPTDAVKLTISDSSLSLTVTSPTSIRGQSGGTVRIDYNDAGIGPNRSVSVAICSGDGTVLFYGRPVDCTSGNGSGTASFIVPSGLTEGDYTLKVFNEEVNGDNKTDYASTPVEINLTVVVDNTPPTVSDVTLPDPAPNGDRQQP